MNDENRMFILASEVRESNGSIQIVSKDVIRVTLSDGKEYPMFAETLRALVRLGYIEAKETGQGIE